MKYISGGWFTNALNIDPKPWKLLHGMEAIKTSRTDDAAFWAGYLEQRIVDLENGDVDKALQDMRHRLEVTKLMIEALSKEPVI